jgi:hypothetical protein
MTFFDATYKKQFMGSSIFPPYRKILITLREKAANVINTNWIYSLYWKDETWHEEALSDCNDRISELKKELQGLESIKKILESVEKQGE